MEKLVICPLCKQRKATRREGFVCCGFRWKTDTNISAEEALRKKNKAKTSKNEPFLDAPACFKAKKTAENEAETPVLAKKSEFLPLSIEGEDHNQEVQNADKN